MTKQAITVIASEETYQNLKSFEEITQLNEAVRTYKEKFKNELTKSTVKVLDFIHRYSAKYPGVSFLTKKKIAEKLEISKRTVIRACQLLESLGIIKQYEMKRRKDMLQTSNAIVIQPIQEEKTENVTQDDPKMSHHKNNIFLKQIHNINHLNVNRRAYIKFVPKSLQHYQTYFGKLVKDLYGRIWLAAKKLGVIVDQDTMKLVGFKALEQLKQYIKDGKQLSDEQLCKLAYSVGYNQLKQGVDNKEIFDMSPFYGLLEKINVQKVSFPMEKIEREELDALGVF